MPNQIDPTGCPVPPEDTNPDYCGAIGKDCKDFRSLRARVEELEASETALINERDNYHDWADRLANAIAAHVGEDIGEHTSANSPWANALELIDAETEELPANSDL